MVNNWKRISRKLRAGLVQINGNLTITITKATESELKRRQWIEDGQIMRFNRETGNRDMTWGLRLTSEGRKVFQQRYSWSPTTRAIHPQRKPASDNLRSK